MTFINKKTARDYAYKAGYMSKTVDIYAVSLADAKQRAVEHFKPKKATKSLLWVEPYERPDHAES